MVLCYSLFREGHRLPRWLLAAFVVQCLLEEPVPLLLGSSAAQYDLLEVVPAVLQLVFVVTGLYWTLSGWRADLVEDRRQLRKIFIAIVGTFVSRWYSASGCSSRGSPPCCSRRTSCCR